MEKIRHIVWKFNRRIQFLLLFIMISSSVARANPVLQNVESGSATVQQTSTTTQVNQTSSHTIINWQSFNIQQNEHTHFAQPAGGVALNRINSTNGVSEIYGHLSSTGRIILINQAGIYFGPSAQVDVGSIIVSTSNVSNENFINNKYVFDRSSDYAGKIVNNGSIVAADHGLVALMGSRVENSGEIHANLGNVVLGSGSKFTLDFYGDELINFSVNEAVASSKAHGVTHSGKIYADGGQVIISAKAAQGVVDNVINMTGVIEAKSVSNKQGKIILRGGNSGIVRVAGTIKTTGYTANHKGGTVQITGKQILIDSGALIDASGDVGGGEILIGGNYQGAGPLPNAEATVIGPTAKLYADAVTKGDGGKIIVWADDVAKVYGSIYARGGLNSGNGGFVETSGKRFLDVKGIKVDLTAAHGITGDWLLDPYSLTISNDPDSNGTFDGSNPNTFTSAGSSSNVNVDSIVNNMSTSNVLITTSGGGSELGDITIMDGFVLPNTTTNTLTLNADYSIILNPGVNIYTHDNTLVLNANGGDIVLNSGASIQGHNGGFGLTLGHLQLNAANSVVLYGTIGHDLGRSQFNPLRSVTITAPTTIFSSTGGVAARDHTYNTDISGDLSAYAIYGNVGEMIFNGAFNGPGNPLAAIGGIVSDIYFNGPIGTTVPIDEFSLSNLSSVSHAIHIGNQIISVNDQVYNHPVQIDSNVTLTSNNGNIDFATLVDGTANLIVNAANGTIRFAGAVGSNNPLSSLTTDALDTQFNSDVITNGSQIYHGLVTVNGSYTFTGNTEISFLGGVTTSAGAGTVLNLNGNADTSFTIANSISSDFSDINITGSGDSSLTLLGLGSPIWNILGTDMGNIVSLTGYSGNLSFTSIQNLIGGAGSDTFVVVDGAGLTGYVNGGSGGSDTLDLSALSSPINVTLTGPSTHGFAGNADVGVASFSNMDVLVGNNSGVNTLTGSNTTNTWTISSTDAGTLASGGKNLAFSSIQSLIGGSGNDSFVLNGGSFIGSINGGDTNNVNTLNFSSYGENIRVNLNHTADGYVLNNSNSTILNFSNINNIVAANTGTNILQLPNLTNSLHVTAAKQVYMNNQLNFQEFNTFVGLSGSDVLVFDTAAVLNAANNSATVSGQPMFFNNIALPTNNNPSPSSSGTSSATNENSLSNESIQATAFIPPSSNTISMTSTTSGTIEVLDANRAILPASFGVTTDIVQMSNEMAEIDIQELLSKKIGCLGS